MTIEQVVTVPKAAYASPKLRIYGDMKELTAGGSGRQPEGAKDTSKARKA